MEDYLHLLDDFNLAKYKIKYLYKVYKMDSKGKLVPTHPTQESRADKKQMKEMIRAETLKRAANRAVKTSLYNH